MDDPGIVATQPQSGFERGVHWLPVRQDHEIGIEVPSRIEDLDLGFRSWMAGWKGYYVPDSIAYHRGFASFGPAFGRAGCDRLAARNTLLFAWKNLSGRRLRHHLGWLPIRLLHGILRGKMEFAAA
jgi:GT2 family glycosyltransferase